MPEIPDHQVDRGGERAMTGYNTWERDVFRSYLARVQAKHEREMREKEREEKEREEKEKMEASNDDDL
jgi:hypothetical protein